MQIRIKNNTVLLWLVVFIMPFSFMPELNINYGVPGLKLFNVLALLLFCVFFVKSGFSLRFKDPVQKNALIFLALYTVLYTVAAIRTFMGYGSLSLLAQESLGGGKVTYILSYYIKPVLFLIPCAYVLRFIDNQKSVDSVIGGVVFSATSFSIFVILLGFDNLLSFSGVRGRGLLAEEFRLSLGLHYNSVASILILAFPLSVYTARTGKSDLLGIVFRAAPFIIFFAGIVTQSRAALLSLVASYAMIYLLEPRDIKKKVMVIFSAIALGVCLIAIALPSLLKVFDLGGAGQNPIDYLLSGRLESMWLPLTSEIFSSALRLSIGYGLYGVMLTDVYYLPNFYQASHAHNAYLNLVLDVGLIFSGAIIITAGIFLKRIYAVLKKRQSLVLIYLFISLLMYLVACLSGRSFFPSFGNFWVFIVMALAVSCYRGVLRDNKSKTGGSAI